MHKVNMRANFSKSIVAFDDIAFLESEEAGHGVGLEYYGEIIGHTIVLLFKVNKFLGSFFESYFMFWYKVVLCDVVL